MASYKFGCSIVSGKPILLQDPYMGFILLMVSTVQKSTKMHTQAWHSPVIGNCFQICRSCVGESRITQCISSTYSASSQVAARNRGAAPNGSIRCSSKFPHITWLYLRFSLFYPVVSQFLLVKIPMSNMSSRCHAEASDNTPEELLCWDPLNSDCFQALLEQSGDASPDGQIFKKHPASRYLRYQPS